MWDGHSRPGCKKACTFHFSTQKPQGGMYKKSTAIVEALERWMLTQLYFWVMFHSEYIFAFIRKHLWAFACMHQAFTLICIIASLQHALSQCWHYRHGHHHFPQCTSANSVNSKQVFKGQIILLGMAFSNISFFDACSLFLKEEGKELQTFNKSWKWALFCVRKKKNKSHIGVMVHKQLIKLSLWRYYLTREGMWITL